MTQQPTFTRQFSPQTSAAGVLSSANHQQLKHAIAPVGHGHTKVLIHGLPKSCTREDFLSELKDAGFRLNRDFDHLNFPTIGSFQDYCTMKFKDVSTTRAFMSSFDGRKLRAGHGTVVSVRPFQWLPDSSSRDTIEEFEFEEHEFMVGTGFPRGLSV
jgi:hypothetical protein